MYTYVFFNFRDPRQKTQSSIARLFGGSIATCRLKRLTTQPTRWRKLKVDLKEKAKRVWQASPKKKNYN